MSQKDKIICELHLTEIEVQAVRALIGSTAGGPNEPDWALNRVFVALHDFEHKEGIEHRTLNITYAPGTPPYVGGWRS